MARRIGILTGGGDVPGLNSVIKGVVYGATERGHKVIGFRRGWEGLTHIDLGDNQSRERYMLELTRQNTRTIDRTGGTFLHSSRTNPEKMKRLPPHLEGQPLPVKETMKGAQKVVTYDLTGPVKENLRQLDTDCLIAIGGDDTLSYAARLDREGVKVIAIPKTMDNDVRNTEYCIGFSTAITRATDAINRQRSTIGSHERVGVFRVFGRDAGYTSLYTAYVTAIRCAIPEYVFNLEKMIGLLLEDKRNNPSNYSLVILSEGATWEGYETMYYGKEDAFGHRKKFNIGEVFSQRVQEQTGEETMVSDLTYDLRSGEADFVDKLVANTFGGMALDAIQAGKSGVMTAIADGKFELVPIPDPKLGPRTVDVATMYNTERYRPIYNNKLGLPIFLTRA